LGGAGFLDAHGALEKGLLTGLTRDKVGEKKTYLLLGTLGVWPVTWAHGLYRALYEKVRCWGGANKSKSLEPHWRPEKKHEK